MIAPESTPQARILQIIPAQGWCSEVMVDLDSDGNDIYRHTEVVCWALVEDTSCDGSSKTEFVVGMLAEEYGPHPAEPSTTYHKRTRHCNLPLPDDDDIEEDEEG